ncbi:MAG: DUF5666 domain-containing protein, partial [Bryobacteraceae bacterium]
ALGTPCATIGELETDRNGDARERLPFTLPGTRFSGVFVLTRGGVAQFVSGWAFPTEAVTTAATDVVLKGEIAFIGSNFLRLSGLPIDIVVTQATRFQGVSGLAALRVGDAVEIEGYTRGDGSIVATRIQLDEKPAPPAGPKAR